MTCSLVSASSSSPAGRAEAGKGEVPVLTFAEEFLAVAVSNVSVRRMMLELFGESLAAANGTRGGMTEEMENGANDRR